MRPRKTLEDFPKFKINSVRRGKTSATGYTTFELEGEFDRIIQNISPYWFWLLLGEKNCICPSIKSLNKETWKATLTCEEEEDPNVSGMTLYYLSSSWDACNVWMILDPNWGWNKKRFKRIDAVAEDYETDVSIVDGREVRVWTKLESADKSSRMTHYKPADNQASPPNPAPRLIPGGWKHENCDLCRAHVNDGEFGFCDPDNRWICESCHEKYVLPRDLAFVDEL